MLFSSYGYGQVITSDTFMGNWNDSSIWDCNCIPTSANDVILDFGHQIDLTGFAYAKSVTINDGAAITCYDTMSVLTIEEDFVMYDCDGWYDGIIHIGQDFKLLTSVGGISGQYGRFCVADSTISGANITGTLDICDLSPTSATLDVNTGTIQPSVTFCTSGVCPTNNAAPVTVDDTATTDSTTTVVIDVQANDSDPNGDPLTTTILSGPSNGTAMVQGGDSIQYTPNVSFVGADTIVYIICDNGTPALCDTGMLIITVNPGGVGIDEKADLTNEFEIVPNPSNGKFMIQTTNLNQSSNSVEVRNVLGQLVYNKEVYFSQNQSIVVDLTDMGPGVYYVTVKNKIKRKTEKLVISH